MHISVLLDESIDALSIKKDGTYMDGTLGGAGHAQEIAKHLGPDGTLIGFDLDSDAIARAQQKLAGVSCHVMLRQENFSNVGDEALDGILLDLGWSSFQIADPQRGFSFQQEGPLQMTFAKDSENNVYDIINNWKEETLADLIYVYGDEHASRKIARAIVEARKRNAIQTTGQLVEIIESVIPRKPWQKTHPATKTFQALRIAVNDEYKNLQKALEQGMKQLKTGGRFVIITFHSGEDRIVKNFFREQVTQGIGKLITKKPIIASEEEVKNNPRSRSAKLRILEKI